MQTITQNQLTDLFKLARIKPRLQRELRYRPDEVESFDELELLAIANRSGNSGVLLVQPYEDLYLLPYELSKGVADRQTGRTKPVICDFCYTWQAGSSAASITFAKSDQHTVTFLCCGDLKCSSHVRSETEAAKLSRSQLREDMTDEQRAARLRKRLVRLVGELDETPIDVRPIQ